MKIYALYNPLAGNTTKEKSEELTKNNFPEDEIVLADVTKIADMKAFVTEHKGGKIVLLGGDGTLNKFVNAVDGLTPSGIWYIASGNGNDFAHDAGAEAGKAICIDSYLVNLPTVEVKGKTYKFINGVGYGIDGYCCEEGDKLKAQGKAVNYTSLAISGLLFHFKPRAATVIVDGKQYNFKKTWIAPTMIGRYYGGGMIPTPDQKRDSGLLSLCLLSGKGKIKTLMAFPKIFTGEHVKNKMTTVLSGKKITVKFDTPCALQIDGETVLGVSEYTAYAAESGAASEAAATL